MRTGEKLAIAGVSVLVLVGLAVAAVTPTLLRQVRRVSAPIQRMQRSGKALEALRARERWKPPPADVLTEEQLERFFSVRQQIEALRRRAAPRIEALSRENRNPRTLEEWKQVPRVIEGVSEIVSGEMDAYIEGAISPEEYRWIERLIYERWRGSLRRARTYPLAAHDAAEEIASAAARERDVRVRIRLNALADELRGRMPPPPEGFDAQIHALLLRRIDEIERYSTDDLVGAPFPAVR